MKKGLIQHCLNLLEDKLKDYQNEFQLIQKSSSEDSKSSMGDKYETGPEILNAEKEKLANAIVGVGKLLLTLKSIKTDSPNKTAELGSLVNTNNGMFFLSISMGPIEYQQKEIILTSMISPLGQAFMGRKKGEKILFRDRSYEILEID